MKLYQAYIGVQQRLRCNNLAIPLDIGNRTGDSAREYELLSNLYRQHTEANDTDPWGLVSWKFEWKTSVSIESFIAFCKEKFAKGFECVFINPMIGNESMFLNVWEQGIAVGHVGMDIIFQHLRNVLNLPNPLAMSHAKFAFCNYFMATPRFWGKYFHFVEHCLTLLNREVENGTQVGRANSIRYDILQSAESIAASQIAETSGFLSQSENILFLLMTTIISMNLRSSII